jgi:hypothetical protein
VMILSRTSRNWCTDPIHVIHQSMCINVSYNKYELNNPRKRQNIKKSLKNLKNDDFVTHVTKLVH